MRRLFDASIKVKLFGAFLIVCAGGAAVFVMSLFGFTSIDSSVSTILEENQTVDHLQNIKTYVANEGQYYKDYALTHNKDSFNEARALGVLITEEVDALRRVFGTEDTTVLDDFIAAHDTYISHGESIAAIYVAGDVSGGNIAMKRWTVSGIRMLDVFNELEASASGAMLNAVEKSDNTQSMVIWITVGIASVATAVAMSLSFILSRHISNGVTTISKVLRQIAMGDVTTKVTIKSSDEIGQMAASYGEMQTYMQEMAEAAEMIANGDLGVDVQPKTEKDTLGNAFSSMVSRLRSLIGQIRDIAANLSEAAGQLSESSEQSGLATQQIAETSQQIAQGANEQATSQSISA